MSNIEYYSIKGSTKKDSIRLFYDYTKNMVKSYKNLIMGIDGPQFSLLEYPLIILFIILGGISLMSSSDVITMFLAIELQSYGCAPGEAFISYGVSQLILFPAKLVYDVDARWVRDDMDARRVHGSNCRPHTTASGKAKKDIVPHSPGRGHGLNSPVCIAGSEWGNCRTPLSCK